MDTFTTKQKLEFIEGWRSSGLSQEQYCSLRREDGGPSPRCLRSWLARLTTPAGIQAEVRSVARRAVAELQDLVRAIDEMEHASDLHYRHAGGDRGRVEPRGVAEPPEAVAAVCEAAEAAGVENPVKVEQHPVVRPLVYADPWSRGGGFLGPP